MSGVDVKPECQWRGKANKSAKLNFSSIFLYILFQVESKVQKFSVFFSAERKSFKLIFQICSGLQQHPLWFWRGCEKH